jgi:hypothetical protein
MLVSTCIVSKHDPKPPKSSNGTLGAEGKVRTEGLELGRFKLRICQLDLQ